MNEEEEEALLEDPRVCQNRFARERHAAWSKEQRTTDASWWAAQRAHELDKSASVGER
jgi:hypothetical protein